MIHDANWIHFMPFLLKNRLVIFVKLTFENLSFSSSSPFTMNVFKKIKKQKESLQLNL